MVCKHSLDSHEVHHMITTENIAEARHAVLLRNIYRVTFNMCFAKVF